MGKRVAAVMVAWVAICAAPEKDAPKVCQETPRLQGCKESQIDFTEKSFAKRVDAEAWIGKQMSEGKCREHEIRRK